MESSGAWHLTPNPALLRIFSYLGERDVLNAGKWNVCKEISPGSQSWLDEYIRLKYRTPVVETEVLTMHTDQVLHVNFSHDGKTFASSSKDGYIRVWDSAYPCTIRHGLDMRMFSWNYTQFSQFNESDTLLLVSGVHFGMHTASGEIAVFDIQDGFSLQCRVLNKPYDVFGTWYTETYLLSGHLHLLGNSVSCSVLWLNKASQETESERKPVVKQLFKFYNKNSSYVRSIMVANSYLSKEVNCSTVTKENQIPEESIPCNKFSAAQISALSYNIHYPCSVSSYKEAITEEKLKEKVCQCSWEEQESDNEMEEIHRDTCIERILDDREKLLIFTMGSLTYVPHQIGIKRIKPFKFVEQIATTPSLSQRIAEHQERMQSTEPTPDWNDERSVNHLFDRVDVTIDMHGHIIGMGLSPDHRYLYVNIRSWPKNYVIEDPWQPPPIAQEIEIHVIDLTTFKEEPMTYHSHKAFTSEEETFFIFLDVCDKYVASGAEDKHAYLWDRHYGMCIAKLPHMGVVNSVAFNPENSEMLVTASDDFTLKVWRSRNEVKKLGIKL